MPNNDASGYPPGTIVLKSGSKEDIAAAMEKLHHMLGRVTTDETKYTRAQVQQSQWQAKQKAAAQAAQAQSQDLPGDLFSKLKRSK